MIGIDLDSESLEIASLNAEELEVLKLVGHLVVLGNYDVWGFFWVILQLYFHGIQCLHRKKITLLVSICIVDIRYGSKMQMITLSVLHS